MNSKKSIGSVTGWIQELKQMDPAAQEKIWDRFTKRLVQFSERKLRRGYCRLVDAEDIACMAFTNFFEKSPEHFERLVNRNDLWQILAMLAERRAIDHIRMEATLRNGGGRVVTENSLGRQDSERIFGLDDFPGGQSTADFDAVLAEEAELRLESLNNETLRRIAVERMQGSRNQEIADKLKISLRSVERKLGEIKNIFRSNAETRKRV